MAINSVQYSELEKFFSIILNDLFGVRSRFEIEIHAGDIFYRRGLFENLTEAQVKTFFSELIQLLAKFDIRLLVGVACKLKLIPSNSHCQNSQLKIVTSAVAGFLNLAERHLAHQSSAGLLIADSLKHQNNFHKPNAAIAPLGKNGVKIDLVLQRLFYDMQKWRIDPFSIVPKAFATKYKFESMASMLLDNIHYTDSRYSPMTQLADCMLFLTSRYLNKLYRSQSNLFDYESYDFPVDHNSASMFLNNINIAVFDPRLNDFNLFQFRNDPQFQFFLDLAHGKSIDRRHAKLIFHQLFLP